MHIPEVSIASKAGRHGDALRFAAKSDTVLCYKASVNGMQPTDHWSGTVSLWLRLSPDPDLPAGYCDPLQITSKKWNDAAFFVDFDQTLPRDFRLGAFSDHDFWNPSQIKWDDIPAQDRPMIVVKPPSFSREKWTHVAFTFENLNSTRGDAASTHLYIDGKLQGSLHKPMQFTWSGTDSSEAIMMLGINYVGDMDELAIYKRALSAEQIHQLFMHPEEYAGRRR
ncbi:MAG: LamG domain-containing protein, partial [Planctomycetaceae bacterium]|nr:LamG domain-containing protein [Planctomycetaceae bacterium]